MKARAFLSFCGVVSMAAGEVCDIDPALARDLEKVGYVEIIGEPPAKAEKPAERKEKANGNESKIPSSRRGKKHVKR